MKKKTNPAYPPPQLLLTNPDSGPSKISQNDNTRTPSPPSEETVLRLNAIVKEMPFCYYYREKSNDILL